MQTSTTLSPTVDVLLICALKDEYDQVKSITNGLMAPGWQEQVCPRGWVVADALFETSSGGKLCIRATWATHMGREQAQAVTSMLIQDNPARCIAMSGICAGRRGKVSLGDVIFADRLWSYDAGKVVVENDSSIFQGDMLQYRPTQAWVQRMQAFAIARSSPWLDSRPALPLEHQEDWVLLRLVAQEDPRQSAEFDTFCPDWSEVLPRLWKRKWVEKPLELTLSGKARAEELNLLYPKSLPNPPEFQIHVAPMATGAAVTEDTGIFHRLSNSMRKVLGVDMEASGLGALGDIHAVPVLVAKGVSDFGDPFKDDRYRHFAARAAAECLVAFLRQTSDLFAAPKLQLQTVSSPSPAIGNAALPNDLIVTFAEAYPDIRDARALWERAGGRGSEVENNPRPRDMWQRIWMRSIQGASVKPSALLRVAMEDLPSNDILIRHFKSLDVQ